MSEDLKQKVVPFYIPPSLVLKQLGSVLYYTYLIKWNRFAEWLVKSGFKTLPVASGAYGMGCIGFPAHPVWEVTLACNFKCIHCHASSGKPLKDELSTEEGLKLLEEIARVKEFRMLVLTGGEPLVRKDIFELMEYGKKLGFTFVIATNASLITEEVAFKLKKSGVSGVAVSLDSVDNKTHNRIRGNNRAFELAMEGIKNAKKAGIAIQINFTAMDYNLNQLEKTIEFVDKIGADIMLVYQLVPVGRGKGIVSASLGRENNKKLCEIIFNNQRKCRTIIEPVAMPQYWSCILGKNGGRHLRKIGESFFYGCTAGRDLVYIKANGDVWPCPFIEISAGNVRETPFSKIWGNSKIFRNLRERRKFKLKGKCKNCSFNEICGGCRGRAWALKGDYLEEDPYCFLDFEVD